MNIRLHDGCLAVFTVKYMKDKLGHYHIPSLFILPADRPDRGPQESPPGLLSPVLRLSLCLDKGQRRERGGGSDG